MTDKFQTLYGNLLKELGKELKSTEDIYLKISQSILSGLADSTEVVHDKKIQLLEETYQQKISGLLTDFGRIYQGNIEIFPIPENAGLIQRMEIRNRQAEELENILTLLLKQNNVENPFFRTADKVIPPVHASVCCCCSSESLPEEIEMRPAILVCGRYNTGKSSLVQAVTQLNSFDCSRDDSSEIAVYETPVAAFIDSSNMDFEESDIHSYAEMILNKSYDLMDFPLIDTINCIWYCIDGSSMQLSKQDQDLIRLLKNNVLLVVTKCDLMQKEQTQILMKHLTELIDKEQIIMVSAEDGNGLCRLVNQTQKLCRKNIKGKNFSKDWKSFFKDKLSAWQEFMSDEADCYTSWAAKRVSSDPETLDSEAAALICKIAVIYGRVINGKEITALKKCAGKTSEPEDVIRAIGQAAKSRFESDTALNKTTPVKRVCTKKQTLSKVRQK